jgi:hypothetical protein
MASAMDVLQIYRLYTNGWGKIEEIGYKYSKSVPTNMHTNAKMESNEGLGPRGRKFQSSELKEKIRV